MRLNHIYKEYILCLYTFIVKMKANIDRYFLTLYAIF